MSERKVRMGIDVGGTHTKAVAIDNATHEIIGKSSVKTTHDDKAGVATGVVQAFKNCLKENNIDPKDVIFVAHSTTQATNALIEGDVAQVGVIGIGGKGPGGWIAKAQTNLKDIDLGSGAQHATKKTTLSGAFQKYANMLRIVTIRYPAFILHSTINASFPYRVYIS